MSKRPAYQYHYWSKRLTAKLSDELSINRRARWRWNLSGRLPVVGVGIEAQQQDYSLGVDETAAKLESSRFLMPFTELSSPQRTPYYLCGVSRQMKLMRSLVGDAATYATSAASDGSVTHLCLYGSIDNFIGYKAAPREAEWSASSWPAIHDLLSASSAYTGWNDEARAFEAVKWMHENKENSPVTFAELESADWSALIYLDVATTPDRWITSRKATGRILVGAPLWIRTLLRPATELAVPKAVPSSVTTFSEGSTGRHRRR
jgi:hypothetical protein